MQQYQFDKIYSEMGKEFGKIKKGEEENYAMLLFPMESNALKIHRAFPRSNSRRMREATGLVLFDVKSRISGSPIDTGRFRNEDNERLEKALLMAFDPYENIEIKEITGEIEGKLHEYYRLPVMCLLRIKESIDNWEKRNGSDGYFDFIESHMGSQITGNKMHFTVFGSGDWIL